MVRDAAAMGRPSDLADARAAIPQVTRAFVRLLQETTHEGPVLGAWGVGEVACHVSHVFRVDTDSIAGRRLPEVELRPGAVAAMNDAELATDSERDLGVLAERIESALAEFLEVSAAPSGEQVTWLDGVRIPASAAACHLLEEILVHGHDIASATGRPWKIEPAYAVLAISGAGAPIVNAAGPLAFVDPDRAQGFHARFDISLRGHDRFSFLFQDGLTMDPATSGPFDAHLSAEPTAALLLMLGRVDVLPLALRGKVFVWGRRPWMLLRSLRVWTPP